MIRRNFLKGLASIVVIPKPVEFATAELKRENGELYWSLNNCPIFLEALLCYVYGDLRNHPDFKDHFDEWFKYIKMGGINVVYTLNNVPLYRDVMKKIAQEAGVFLRVINE